MFLVTLESGIIPCLHKITVKNILIKAEPPQEKQETGAPLSRRKQQT